jgi:hypothetical protein
MACYVFGVTADDSARKAAPAMSSHDNEVGLPFQATAGLEPSGIARARGVGGLKRNGTVAFLE